MIVNSQQFYRFSVYPIALICDPLFRYLRNFSNFHSHRMAMNRDVFDPFDLGGIGFDSALKARHRGLLRSVRDSMGLLASMGIIETFSPTYFQGAMRIFVPNWPSSCHC